jgi:hypothetical protein
VSLHFLGDLPPLPPRSIAPPVGGARPRTVPGGPPTTAPPVGEGDLAPDYRLTPSTTIARSAGAAARAYIAIPLLVAFVPRFLGISPRP